VAESSSEMSAPEGSDQLMDALRGWGVVFGQFSRHFGGYAGLRTTESEALMHIVSAEDEGTPLTHAELSQRVGLSSGATSSLLNRLEASGHVERRRERTDRRVVTVRSTAVVHQRVQDFFADVDVDLRATLVPYPPELLGQVTDLVASMTAAAARHLTEPSTPPTP
jgi:MarR family transcriptional regulator, organic hydroperoxide resistance regulator